MIRKKPFRVQLAPPAPIYWVEEQRAIDSSEHGSSRVSIVDVSSKDIAKKQLNPSEIKLHQMIEAGVTIEPGQVRTILNVLDPADVERFNNEAGLNVYNYVMDNKDKILPSEKEVEETIKNE